MYDTIWQYIQAGGYHLEEVLQRINVLYAECQLTDDERTDLITAARENADAESEYDQDWQTSFAALEARVAALEALHSSETETEEWPEYVQPTGAHDAYYNGGKITYNGVRYICTAPEGVACVWTPDVYPAYWEAQQS